MVTMDAIAHSTNETVKIANSIASVSADRNGHPGARLTGAAFVEATIQATITLTGSDGRRRGDENGGIDHRQDHRQHVGWKEPER